MLLYDYHFVNVWFDNDAIMDDMDRKHFKPLFPQPTGCILSSHLPKAIHMNSTPGTTAFSCQIVVSFEAYHA